MCACVCVCPAQGLVGILGGREEMKGAEDERRDQQQHGAAAWKDQQHACAPNTAHITHPLHTLEVQLVEGRSMKPWRKEDREGGLKKSRQRGPDTDPQASTCTHQGEQGCSRMGPKVHL